MEPITVNVSVRELVAFSIPVEESRGFSMQVARDGVEGHQAMHTLLKQQVEATGAYQKEIPVSMSSPMKTLHCKSTGKLGRPDRDEGSLACVNQDTRKALNLIEVDETRRTGHRGAVMPIMTARDKVSIRSPLFSIITHKKGTPP